MTERPTEQTHARLTGLDAPRAESRPESRQGAPTLPPMPPEQEKTPLSERLQQKLSAVRQAAVPTSAPPTPGPPTGPTTAPASPNGASAETTTVGPAARPEATSAPAP